METKPCEIRSGHATLLPSPQRQKFPATLQIPANQHPAAPEMFNILLALESARGLLSVRDVAELLGKSTFTIYRMAESRKIPSLMIGGSAASIHRCWPCGFRRRSHLLPQLPDGSKLLEK